MAGANGPESRTRQSAPGGAIGLSRGLSAVSWAAVPLGIGIVSRLVSITIILVTTSLNPDFDAPRLVPAAGPLTAWDAQWYLSIAERGYHAFPIQVGPDGGHHDIAFFPGWPVLIRIATFGVLSPSLVAIVAANVLALAALAVVWRVLATPFGETTATHAVALLAFSPASYVLSMAYSEPLFLLLAGLTFLTAAYPGRRAALSALAMLTRVSAVAILAAAGVTALLEGGRRRQIALWTIAGGVVGLSSWFVAAAWITHNPLGLLRDGSAGWAVVSGWRAIATSLMHPSFSAATRIGVWFALLVGAVLAFRRSRELGVYSAVSILLGLLPGGFVYSLPRYALVAFPAFAGLASIGGRRWTALLLVASIGLQAYFALDAFGIARVLAP